MYSETIAKITLLGLIVGRVSCCQLFAGNSDASVSSAFLKAGKCNVGEFNNYLGCRSSESSSTNVDNKIAFDYDISCDSDEHYADFSLGVEAKGFARS